MVDGYSAFEPNVGLVQLVRGLTGLCGFMLALREQETDTSIKDTLEVFGRHFAER
jgi:hypothetical protein